VNQAQLQAAAEDFANSIIKNNVLDLRLCWNDGSGVFIKHEALKPYRDDKASLEYLWRAITQIVHPYDWHPLSIFGGRFTGMFLYVSGPSIERAVEAFDKMKQVKQGVNLFSE
jgi:hypothetical protein